MPSRRVQAHRRGTNTARRPVEWLRARTAVTNVAGAAGVTAAAFDLTGAFPKFLDFTSPTIVRVRGELAVSALLSTGGIISWAAGFVKMSTKSFGVGILAIPIPNIDDADWMWFHGGSMGDGGSTAIQPEEDVQHVVVDTKAMRKFQQDDDTLVFVFANSAGVVGSDFIMALQFSILVKE